MNPKIEISSLSFSKLKNDYAFTKYNIEASLDEAENTDSEVVLKYKLILLSNPTNTKISVEGIARLYGDQVEITRQLSPDEKNVPMILNSIYQEVFPLFFIMSKSMQIPCPAYRLSQMSGGAQTEKVVSEPVQETLQEPKRIEVDIPQNEGTIADQIELVEPVKEQLIEQQM